MARQRELAGKAGTHHARFEVHAIRAADFGARTGQALLDEGFDLVGLHWIQRNGRIRTGANG